MECKQNFIKCDSKDEFVKIEEKINKAMLDNGFYFRYWAKIKDDEQKPPYLITIPFEGVKYDIIINCLNEDEKNKIIEYTFEQLVDLGITNI